MDQYQCFTGKDFHLFLAELSPKVIQITPNRNLISPKVTKNTFGELGTLMEK
jgi:hypothetical protein